MEPILIEAEKMETIEQYVNALISTVLTIQTCMRYHAEAMKKEIVEEDLKQYVTLALFEFNQALSATRKLLEMIEERTDLDLDKSIEEFGKMLNQPTRE
jgi:hypothetical protein